MTQSEIYKFYKHGGTHDG